MTTASPRRHATADLGPIAVDHGRGALLALRAAMRLQIGGGGKRLSCELVGEALEMAPRKVRAIRDGEQEPGFGEGLVLAGLLGPATFNSVTSRVGYAGARQLDDEHACPFETLAVISSAAATLAQALHDTVIDHTERPGCIAALRGLADDAQELAAQLEREGNR